MNLKPPGEKGTGFPKILRALKKNESPKPVLHTDENRSYFVVEFPIQPKFKKTAKLIAKAGAQSRAQSISQVAPEVTPEVTPEVKRLLFVFRGAMDRQSLQKQLGLKAEKNFRLLYLRPAVKFGLIEMTIPDKPTSRLQKYRLTKKGADYLQNQGKK